MVGDWGPIHPAKGLEITAVIENSYVLADAKFSGFHHRCIHHFPCQLRRDAVFLDPDTFLHLKMYCVLITSHFAAAFAVPQNHGSRDGRSRFIDD